MIRRAYRVWLRYLQPERNFRRLSRTAAWGHGRSMLRKAGGPARAVFTGWLLGNALIWDLKLPGSISHWYYYNERWLGGHPDAGRVYAPRFATEMVRSPRERAEPRAHTHSRVYGGSGAG